MPLPTKETLVMSKPGRAWKWAHVVLGWACVLGALPAAAQQPESSPQEPPSQATRLLRAGQAKQALALLDGHLKRHPQDDAARRLRIQAHLILAQPHAAEPDARLLARKHPRNADYADLLGSVLFHQGKVKEALGEFDRAIRLDPQRRPGHWQRGIACYYVGQYEQGARQFELYLQVDAADVENAVWHYLCVARSRGHQEARKRLFPPGRDPRVPLPEVYRLFAGRGTPQQVLDRLKEKNDSQGRPLSQRAMRLRRFYAHLYLGLYYEVHGDIPQAKKHLDQAIQCRLAPHYMWYVARVHRRWLEGKLGPQAVPPPGKAGP